VTKLLTEKTSPRRSTAARSPSRPPSARSASNRRSHPASFAGAGNHSRLGTDGRAEAREREATEAGLRFSRHSSDKDDETLARSLRPAPAAAVRVPGSRGETLPRGLLEELETAFGADLGALRIHRDPEAGATAAAARARAFAAGSHLFFAPGSYDPMSPEGRALLAHEVAHALQQTGRRNRDGDLAATEVGGGSGEIQRAEAPVALPLPTSDPTPTLEELVGHYGTAFADLEALLNQPEPVEIPTTDGKTVTAPKLQLQDRLGEALADPARGQELGRELTARLGRVTLELVAGLAPATGSLLGDALKLTGQHDTAATLLGVRPGDETSFFSAELYAAFVASQAAAKEPYQWVRWVWKNDAFFADLRELAFTDSVRTFLLGPTREIPSLGPDTSFRPTALAMLAEARAPTALIPNELFHGTLWAVYEADRLRRQALQDAARAVAPKTARKDLTLYQRLKVAEHFTAWLERAAAGDKKAVPTETPELRVILDRVIPNMLTVTEDARGLIRDFLAVAHARVGRGDFGPDILAAVEDLESLGERPELAPFLATVAEQMEAIFTVRDEKVLPREEYGEAVAAAIKALRLALHQEIEGPVLRRVERFEEEKQEILPEERHLMLLRGWLLAVFPEFLGYLRRYPETYATQDRDLEVRFPQEKPADYRIFHRIELADWLLPFAGAIGREDLYELAFAVRTSTQAGLTESQIAFLSEWTEITDVPVGKLREDFSARAIIENWRPLTVGNLAHFFEEVFFLGLAEDLEKVRQENFFKPDRAAITEAVDRTKERLALPRKYVMPRYDLALRPEDHGHLGPLIGAHPKTVEKLRQLGEPDTVFSQAQGIFFWTFPPLAEIVGELQAFPQLQGLIDLFEGQIVEMKGVVVTVERPRPTGDGSAEGATPEPPESSAPEAKEPAAWLIWLERLDAALRWWRALSKERRKELSETLGGDPEAARKTFTGDLQTRAREAFDKTTEKAREVSIMERSNMVGHYLRPLLQAYDRYSHFDEAPFGGVVYEIPNKALKWLDVIATRTFPPEEHKAHLAIAVLEVADVLWDRFQNIDRLDIAAGWRFVIDATKDEVATWRFLIARLLSPEAKAQEEEARQPEGQHDPKKESWIDQRLALLDKVLAHFDEIESDLQKTLGFGARKKGDSALLFSVGHGFTIGLGEVFVIDGIEYKLLAVAEEFEYHPPIGGLASVLTLYKSGEDPEEVAPEDRGDRILLQVLRDGIALDVTAGDDERLKELSHAVTLESIVRGLENTAEVIQKSMELGLEVVELVPGFGQAAMGARIGASIIAFLAGGEFDDILDMLYRGPQAAFDTLKEKLSGKELFNPDTLWRFLLFGDATFLSRSGVGPGYDRHDRRALRRRKGASAKLARIAGALGHIGASLGGAIANVQEKIQGPLRGLQLFVLSRPLVVRLLRAVEGEIYSPWALDPAAVLGRAGETMGDLTAQARALPEKIAEIAQKLNELELPDTLIETKDLLDILIEIIVDRLGKKAELGAEVVLGLLDAAGYKDTILEKLAAEIEAIGFDPNALWRSLRRDYIDPQLEAARGAVLDRVYGILREVPFLGSALGEKPGLGDFTIQEGPRGFEGEAEGLFAGGEPPPHAGGGGIPDPGAGRPLGPELRGSLESSFGHDFSHVRLHTGGAGARMAEAYGAEAVTSGSHVFLGSGLTPEGGPGRRVLHHELTHVLQQTGSRPLDRRHSPLPTLGSPGRGLRWEPAREEAADRVAREIEAGTGEFPIRPGGPAAGFQPKVTRDFLSDLLRHLTSFGPLEKFAETITEKTKGVALDLGVREEISRLYTHFNTLRREAEKKSGPKPDTDHITYTDPFGDANKEILSRLASELGSDFNKIIPVLAKDAQATIRVKKKKGPGGKKVDAVHRKLNHGTLGRNLAAYIYAKTGVAAHFELNTRSEKVPDSTERVKRLVIDAPIKKIKISYVFLGAIGGTSAIWTQAMRGTWPTLDTKKDRKYRAILKTYLSTRSLMPGVYQKKKFAFSDDIKAYVEASATRASDLAPEQLPPKSYYLDTRPGTAPYSPELGQLRLRLGLHGDGSQTATDRESHHVPQYLLLEYFANKKEQKPFVHPLSAYAGINPGTYQPRRKKAADPLPAPETVLASYAPTTGKKLTIHDLEKGSNRGHAMPSIMLAEPVHQGSNLHVHTEPDDSGSGPRSQGNTIHREFRNFAREEIKGNVSVGGSSVPKTDLLFDAKKTQEFVDHVDATEVRDGMYRAMRKTYGWIWNLMLRRLERGLKEDEIGYYHDLVEQSTDPAMFRAGSKTSAYTIEPSEMNPVLEDLKTHNSAVMSKAGWDLPAS